MLPARQRVTRSEDFARTIRRGVKAGRSTLVVYLLVSGSTASAMSDEARAGFVVPKTVGNSVIRHRVVRRLRHLVGNHLRSLPPGALVVVRALPPAATATSDRLGTDLASALRTVGRRVNGSGSGRH